MKPQPTSLVLLTTRASSSLAQRVAEAAKRVDQPIAAWLRMAIIEKLERDAGS